MRFLARTALLAVVLALLVQNMVLAGDGITDAAQALQHTPVYIVPGTEGTDVYTSGKLQELLRNNDGIVLVMFPAAMETELGDFSTIASRLSEKLGNQRIIGLAVGNKLVGYSLTLPVGVAADQMRRAESVSNDPITALGSFARNIHLWQANQPKQPTPVPSPTPTPLPSESPKEGGLSWLLWLFVVLAAAVTVFIIYLWYEAQNNKEEVNFEVPGPIKNPLKSIYQKRMRINDRELQERCEDLCKDIVRYFQVGSNDELQDARFIKDRLVEVLKVLDKYVDIQENPRYYFYPQAELEKGKQSIVGFSDYVLESIRRGAAVDLASYTVNTEILNAQHV